MHLYMIEQDFLGVPNTVPQLTYSKTSKKLSARCQWSLSKVYSRLCGSVTGRQQYQWLKRRTPTEEHLNNYHLAGEWEGGEWPEDGRGGGGFLYLLTIPFVHHPFEVLG